MYFYNMTYFNIPNLFQVDGIEAMAGGAATGDVLKKLKDLELENKDLKKGTIK